MNGTNESVLERGKCLAAEPVDLSALDGFYARYGKRFLDIALSLTAMIVAAPVCGVLALLIRLTSPGPILFIQPRVGMGGISFDFLKFRSMRTDQDFNEFQARAQELAKRGALLKVDNDPRITPVGRFIRKTSLDELPQLLNVLRGDMSLVGPRPLVEFMFLDHPKEREMRCRVRPGLTGYWQILARNNCSLLAHMWDHDLRYLREVSLWTDLKIMAITVPAVLFCKGAK